MLNARYDHWFRQLEKMTDYDAYGLASLSLRYLLGDRLKLSLAVSDPFHQRQTDYRRVYNWFTEEAHIDYRAQLISLTASCALGGSKVRRTYRDKKDTETQRAEKHRTVN